MIKIGIVAEIINSENITFADENGLKVDLCEPSQFNFNYSSFKQPYLLINNFERDKYKKIEIKKISSLGELDKMGYNLVSVSCKFLGTRRSYSGQRKFYTFEQKNNPIPKSEVLKNIPSGHELEIDLTNKRIRIRGRDAHPYSQQENASFWRNI